jgi:glycosyltransferase involved in cell wall biosynthesis
MIRTISLFSKAHPSANVHLYCAGDGDLKSEAEQYASSLDLQSKITFLGKIDNPFNLLQCVDIFFFPSKFEGMPNALIEAAVSGLPVIASDIPEHTWFKPDEGWLLCSPEDEFCFLNALERMIANIEFYKSVARDNSIQFREKFSIDKTADLYLDAFYEVF